MKSRGHLAWWGGVAVLSVGVGWLGWSLLPGLATRWAFAAIETHWGVTADAGRVDLDLLTLEARVRDLTLAVVGAEESPFLTLKNATVDLPWSVVFGARAVDLIDIDAPAVSLRMFADGTSNLPVFPPGDPASNLPVFPPGDPASNLPVFPPGDPASNLPVFPPGDPASNLPVFPNDDPASDPNGDPASDPNDVPASHPNDALASDPNGDPASDPNDAPTSDPAGEPWRLGVVRLNRASLSWVDEARQLGVTVDGADLRLNPAGDDGSTAGVLTLSSPTRVTWGGHETAITPLEARLTLDASRLVVEGLVMEAPEGRIVLGGEIALETPETGVGLGFDYGVDLDLTRLAAWLEDTDGLTGAVRITGRVDGPPADPTVTATLESERIGWDGLTADGVAGSARIAGGRVSVSDLRATVAGGVLGGEGTVTLTGDTPGGRIGLSWTDLDAGRLAASTWPTAPVELASSLTGTLAASWTSFDPRAWVVGLENRHRAAPGAGLPLDGAWRFESDDGVWRAEVGGLSVGALTLTGEMTGTAPSVLSEIGATPIEGALEGQVSDLRRLGDDLDRLGLTGALRAADVSGSASLALDVSGVAAAPLVTGELLATGGALGETDGLTLRAGLSATGERWRIDPLDLRVSGNELQGRVAVRRESGAVDGRVRLRLTDLARVDSFMPDGWRVGGSVEVEGALGGKWPVPRLDAAIAGRDLAFAGQHLSSVQGRFQVGPDDLVVEQLSVRQDDGRLEATGRLARNGDYSLRATGRDLRLAPWRRGEEADPLAVRAAVDLDVTGAGSIDDPQGAGTVRLRDLVIQDYTLDRVDLDLTADPDSWRVRAAVPALATVANATVHPADGWRYSFEGALDGTNLAHLSTLAADGPLAADTPEPALEGDLSLRVRADGTLTEPGASTVVVDLDRFAARVDETRVRLVTPVQLRYAPGRIALGALDLRVGETRLTASGGLTETPGSALTAELQGDLRDVAALLWPGGRQTEPGGAPPALAGPFRIKAGLAGSIAGPDLTAELALDGGVVGIGEAAGVDHVPPLTDLKAHAVYDSAGARLTELSGRWAEAVVTASGTIPAPLLAPYLPAGLAPAGAGDAAARVRATVEGLRPAGFAAFFDEGTLDDVAGAVDLEMELEADQLALTGVRGSLGLTALDLVVAGLPITQQRPTRVSLADERVTVNSLAWQVGDAETVLTVGGGVDLVPEPTADLTLTGVADLRVLNAFTSAAGLSGDAFLTARLAGTRAAPRVDGVVEFEDVELRVRDPRLLVSDLSGALVLDGTEMRTVELAGIANGGPVRLDGLMRFPGLRPEGTLTLTGRKIAMVLPPGIRTELATDLQMEVTPDDAVLSGTVSVLRGDYRERVNTAGGLVALLEARAEPVGLDTGPSGLDRLRLDIRVLTEEEIVVSNNYGAGTLAADTRVGGTIARPAVTGRATIGDGGQVFLGGNVFEIETGTVDFVDPDGIAPEIDLTARTQVGNEEITITLAGTAETLTTTMQSTSGLPESDIVSLLLTGRTLDQAGSAPGAVARDQALGLVSGGVLGVAGRSVGLDTVRLDRGQGNVRFDPSLVAGDTDPGTRLTVGKNLNRQVELVASQNLRETGLITWIVNYLPQRNVELRLVVDDEADRSYELRHALSFGEPGAPRQPAAPRAEPRVTAVQFTSFPGLPEPDLRRLVLLKEGDRFDFLRWQDSRARIERALWQRGFQEAVVRTRRDVDEAGTSVALRFDVDPGPRSVLDVRGYVLPDAPRREMEAAWRASVFDTFLSEELERIARRHLVAQGYLQSDVIVVVAGAVEGGAGVPGAGNETGEKRITLDIEPGSPTAERTIRFSGNDRLTDEGLRSLVTPNRDSDAWAGGNQLVDAVLATGHAAGLLAVDARLLPPVFDDAAAALEVAVTEGPVFRVTDIHVAGAVAWTAAQVRAAAAVDAGAVYSADLADTVRTGVLVAYRGAGFNTARVRVEPTIDRAEGGVALLIAVEEGRRRVLRTVEVAGASRTHAGLIDRALQLPPGSPVDPAVWNGARKRLYDLGVFRSVDITAVPLEPAPRAPSEGEDEAVTARVTLEEWPDYELRYGLQMIDERAPASEVANRWGQIGAVADLTRRNLFGRAISLGTAVRFDRAQQTVRGFMSLPSFFGRTVTSNVFGARLRETQGLLTRDVHRLTLEQQVRPRDGITFSYSYNFEQNHGVGAGPRPRFRVDRTADIARLNASLIVERRDDLFNATRGWFHASTLEWGVETLGSDLRFLKYLVQQYYSRPMPRGIVLASAARVGLGQGFRQDVLVSERLFAGGGNTVRGYVQHGLGPVDSFSGEPAGGNASVVLNQEIRFPLWSIFGGVGFLDAGNVFSTPSAVSLRKLRVGTGVGLRAETPVGLFRVDVGFPLSRTGDDPVARWFFSLGQTF